MEGPETLGDRIRQARLARSMTLDEVAEICGVTPAAVSQWESGSTANLKLPGFMRLCAFFMLDPWAAVFGPEGDSDQRVPGAPKRFRFRPERL